MNQLPEKFLERLKSILPEKEYNSGLKSFSYGKLLSIRVNTLKSKKSEIIQELKHHSIDYEEVSWLDKALVLKNITSRELMEEPLIKEGRVYIQSLSSMLPAVILDPRPNESVLDMCAAPGSKTTQMAAMMNNQGSIVSVEKIKNRYYKLRSIVKHLGAGNVEMKLMDARKYRIKSELFDKALVDVPCSSEGRFKTSDKKSSAYWSLRKIKEMVRKQRGLLLSASRLVKPGGTLVYSTCTFAPEENEGVLDWLLKKTEGAVKVVPVAVPDVKSYPALREWEGEVFNREVEHAFRVLPTEKMEGFFIAKLVKN